MENRKPVALQAHGHGAAKNNDTVHDFAKDPIQPYIAGEWVKARGTTLGADNGIGMASARRCWPTTALSTARWKCC